MKKIITFANAEFITDGLLIKVDGEDPIEEIEIDDKEFEDIKNNFSLTKKLKKSKIKKTV